MKKKMCVQPSTILYLSVMDLMMTTWWVETCCLSDTFMVIKEYCCADVLSFIYWCYLLVYELAYWKLTIVKLRWNHFCVCLLLQCISKHYLETDINKSHKRFCFMWKNNEDISGISKREKKRFRLMSDHSV